VAENNVKQLMPFLHPEQVDMTALDAMKLKVEVVEQLPQGDLEQVIREAQERDTMTDRRAMM